MGDRRRRAVSGIVVVGALAAIAMGSCGGSGTAATTEPSRSSDSTTAAASGAPTTDATVTAQDYSFSPTQLTVPTGAQVTVEFRNDGAAEHSFTSSQLGADTEAGGGEASSATFTAPAPGEYEFHCKYHPSRMTGTVTVR